MLNRINLNNLAACALIAAIMCFYAVALLGARTSFVIFPASVDYKEDFNKDGRTDISDVVTLIGLGLKIPGSPVVDYNGDSVFNAVDVITLLLNVKNDKLTPLIPQDTSSIDTTSIDTTGSDTTSVDTTGTEATYIISGYVYCLTGGWGNVQIYLTGDRQEGTMADGSGFYFFRVPDGTYTIIPLQIEEYGFSPPSMTVAVYGRDLQRLDIFAFGLESLPGL